jgi:hypothetical protein
MGDRWDISTSAEEPDHAGCFHMIRWPLRRRHEVRPINARLMINPRHAELETAKEILAEIFQVRAADVEEMIQSRLEERSWSGERTPEDGL